MTLKYLMVPLVLLVLAVALVGSEARAAGKKSASSDSPSASASAVFSAARPLRHVVVRPVGTKAFSVPNGSQVDLTADLEQLMNSAVTASSLFAPVDGELNEICDKHLEISSAITVLQLKVASVGVTFGFTPSSSSASFVTGVSGKAQVDIGSLAMDFGVWECSKKVCTQIIQSEVKQPIDQLDASFEVDFGLLSLRPNLVLNTPLGNAIRKIMNNGVQLLASSDRVQELPWVASVRKVATDTGAVTLDAGFQSRLGAAQELIAYAQTPATGVCGIFEKVAYLHTTSVDAVSSVAQVDQVFNSERGIKEGDLVMVREVHSR